MEQWVKRFDNHHFFHQMQGRLVGVRGELGWVRPARMELNQQHTSLGRGLDRP